jgi:hypothetical protein
MRTKTSWIERSRPPFATRWLLGGLALAPIAISQCHAPSANSAATATLAAPENTSGESFFAAAKEAEAHGNFTEAANQYFAWLARDPSPREAALIRFMLLERESATMRPLAYLVRWPSGSNEHPFRARLRAIYPNLNTPFTRHLVAGALTSLAEMDNDARAAAMWRTASGCVQAASVSSVLGTASEPLLALARDTKLEAEASGSVKQALTSGFGCALQTTEASGRDGVRALAFKVVVKSPTERLTIVLRSERESAVLIDGAPVLVRPERFRNQVSLSATEVAVAAGEHTVAIRTKQQTPIGLALLDKSGQPVATQATVSLAELVQKPLASGNAQSLTLIDKGASAERRTWEAIALGEPWSTPLLDAEPGSWRSLTQVELTLLADDLPLPTRIERVLGRMPSQTGASPASASQSPKGGSFPFAELLLRAELEGMRRGKGIGGAGEGEFRTLAMLENAGAKTGAFGAEASSYLAVRRAYEASNAHMRTETLRALAESQAALGENVHTLALDTAKTLAHADGSIESVQATCALRTSRRGGACQSALRSFGDFASEAFEIQRRRDLLGAPRLNSEGLLESHLSLGKNEAAAQEFAHVAPRGFTLGAQRRLFGTKPDWILHFENSMERVGAAAPMPSLLGSPTLAREVAAWELRPPLAPPTSQAGVVVRRHRERFEQLSASVFRGVYYDLRTINGTTDVAEHADAPTPMITGEVASTLLRRRILKPDGRVIEPDPNPNASQGHADLSQLQPGDSVEVAMEFWFRPDEDGNVGVYTPDLLPERTHLEDAEITFIMQASTASAGPSQLRKWGHKRLETTSRIVEAKAVDAAPFSASTLGTMREETRYRLKNEGPRKIEDDAPQSQRFVRAGFSNYSFAKSASYIRRTLAALETDETTLKRAFADATDKANAIGQPTDLLDPQKPFGRAELTAALDQAGRLLKRGDPSLLSDMSESDPTTTIAGMLAKRLGSRTLLVHELLRHRGVKHRLLAAESIPWDVPDSTDKTTAPPLPDRGRFMHPLLEVSLPGEPPLMVDADVAGKPLRPGQITPELRGRMTMDVATGEIAPLAVNSGGERDTIEIRLDLTTEGDAKGTIAMLLHGSVAQDLSDSFREVVGFEREKALRTMVLAWLPLASVDSVSMSSQAGDDSLAMRADVTIGSFAERTKQGLRIRGSEPFHSLYPRAYAAPLSAFYGSGGQARSNSLMIYRPLFYKLRRQITLPANTTLREVPTAFAIDTPSVHAHRSIATRGQTIEETFDIDIPSGNVSLADYPAFMQRLSTVDGAFLRTLLIQKDKP